MTIAVTGGNGEFGSAVITHLTSRTTQPVVATVRDTAKARTLDGVAYRPGDFDVPVTLATSLADVETVLINATFFGMDPSQRLPRVTAAIGAAADAGVQRIVLTSWPDLERATVPTVQDYRQLEAAAKTAGPDWVILRLSTGMADALARDVVWGRQVGELVAPAKDACVTPAAITDLAEAAAAVLTHPGYDGEVFELTGPNQIRWDDLAELAGVPFRAVSDDEYTRYVSKNFALPTDAATQLTALYGDFRSGWASKPTATLSELLDRPAVPGAEAVSRRVDMFPGA